VSIEFDHEPVTGVILSDFAIGSLILYTDGFVGDDDEQLIIVSIKVKITNFIISP